MTAPVLTEGEVQEGWVEWNGGECPVADDDLIDVRIRDGRVYYDADGFDFRWEHGGGFSPANDLIAYRVVPK